MYTLPSNVKSAVRTIVRTSKNWRTNLSILAAGGGSAINDSESVVQEAYSPASGTITAYINAVETYARNLRPNRDPAQEKARKAKYATKGVSYGLLLKGNYAHCNELRCVFGSTEHIDRASSDHHVALFSTPEKATAYGQRDSLCKQEGFKIIRVTNVKDANSFTHVTEKGSTKVRRGLYLAA